MFQAIGQVHEDKEIAVRVLTWLLYGARPLRLNELAISVMIKPGRQFHADQKLDPDDILGICRSFIKLNEQTNVVEFAHFSVQEYLTAREVPVGEKDSLVRNPDFIDEIAGHTLLMECCLTCLMSNPFRDCGLLEMKVAFDTKFRTTEYLSYAVFNWPSHAEKTGLQEDSVRSVVSFLLGGTYLAWSQLLDATSADHCLSQWIDGTRQNLLQWPVHNRPPPLYYAASFGLLPVVQELLHRGDGAVNLQGGSHDYSLIVAAAHGHGDVVWELICAGADLEVSSCYTGGGTALQNAAMGGHKATVETLIRADADLYARDSNGCVPLGVMSGTDLELVKMLGEYGLTTMPAGTSPEGQVCRGILSWNSG
jgi:hypothetical protein